MAARLGEMLVHALLLAGGLVPLAAMLAALFAATWIRDGRREATATVTSHEDR